MKTYSNVIRVLLLAVTYCVVAYTCFAQGHYFNGTKWTELRLDTTKYDAWYTMSEDGKARCIPNYERTDYYVQGDTIHRGNHYSMVWRHIEGQADSLVYLVAEPQEYGAWRMQLCSFYGRDGYGEILGPCSAYASGWNVGDDVNTDGLPSCMFTGSGRFKSMGVIREIRQGTFGTSIPLTYVVLDDGRILIPGIGITSWNGRDCVTGPCMAWWMEHRADSNVSNDYRSILVHFERDGEVLYDQWPTPDGGMAQHVQDVFMSGSQDNSAVYDLQGRKVEGKPSRGIYIIGGKKRVVE